MSYLEEFINLIPFTYLKIVPFFTVVAVYFLSFFFRRKKFFIWLVVFFPLLACTFTLFHLNGGSNFTLLYGSVLSSFTVLLFPFFWLHGERKTEKEKPLKNERRKEEIFTPEKDFAVLSAPSVPQAVTNSSKLQSPPQNDAVNGDVQLAHVFSVLKKLQSAKLSAGDRLEVDVIYNMLTVYRSKATLSVEETHTLNNYLATLLKLMSKYSV